MGRLARAGRDTVVILQWHPEMDVIVDANGHRRQERDERRQEAREFLADAALISALTETFPGGPIRLREVSPGRWVPGENGTHLLIPQYKHGGVSGWSLVPVAPPGPGGPFAVLGYDLPGREPPEPWPAPDPVEEIRASLAEPLGLDADQLIAAIPDHPPGTCKGCRTGKAVLGGQCWYCANAAELRNANPIPVQPARRRENSFTAACTGMLLAAFVLTVLSVKLADFWLMIMAAALFIAGVRGLRR